MDVVGQFLSTLAGQGIVGVFVAASLFANWYLVRALQQVNDKRVQDAQDISTKILDPIDAIKRNSELLVNLFTRFLNNNGTIK